MDGAVLYVPRAAPQFSRSSGSFGASRFAAGGVVYDTIIPNASFGGPPACLSPPGYARIDFRGTPFGIANLWDYRNASNCAAESDQLALIVSAPFMRGNPAPTAPFLFYRRFASSCSQWLAAALTRIPRRLM